MSGSEYNIGTSESDASVEPEKKPKTKQRRRKKRTADDDDLSVPKNYHCVPCGRGFTTLNAVQVHLKKCEEHQRTRKQLTCDWCKLKFTNRGALAMHAFHLHGDPSYRAVRTAFQTEFYCHICAQGFSTHQHLIFHIRRLHFNLKGKAPYAEMKKVNQVWFENVMNSKNIIEIRKTGLNRLVMKKIDENSAIKVNNDNARIIDVSHIYPTNNDRNPVKVKCKYCGNFYGKRDYKKHVEEIHMNLMKHQCNNCHRSFKRNYQFIKHICSKVVRKRGVRRGSSEIQITNVKSLSVPLASLRAHISIKDKDIQR